MTAAKKPQTNRPIRAGGIRCARFLVVAWCVVALACGTTSAIDTTWIQNSDGLWTLASAWDSGEPTSTAYNVFIDDGDSSVTVTLDVSRSINNLQIGSDDTLLLADGASLTPANVTNDGLISLQSTGTNTVLRISSTRQFSGSGVLRLGGTPQDQIRGAGVLQNGPMHTIEGAGQLGVDETDFINDGTVDANVAGGVLLVNPETNFDNDGTMQATGGGILRLSGSASGNYMNTGGLIRAVGTGSRVELISNPNVSGGTLETSGGGLIQINSGTSARVSGVTLDGELIVTNNSTLNIGGTIDNLTGSVISVRADTANATLSINGNTTLQGGGTVRFSDTGGVGTAVFDSPGILTNVDNTIEGFGSLGADEIDFINQAAGTFDANVMGRVMVLNPENDFNNEGVLQATGGGILRLSGSATGNYMNTGGLIRAVGAGSRVELISNPNVSGGTLNTSGGGLIQINSGTSARVSGVTLDGELIVTNNSTLNIGGTNTILPGSVLHVAADTDNASLRIIGNTTLQGEGTVRFSQTGNGGTARFAAVGVLTNVDCTLEGVGSLGADEIDFVNQPDGIFDANVAGGVLSINPENNFDNDGTMQATGGGILRLSGSASGNYINTGGLIRAVGAGSRVELVANPRVSEGTLRTTAGGLIRVNSGNAARVSNLTLDGNLLVPDNATLDISGTINNLPGSVLTVSADGNDSNLRILGNTTLQGGGTVRFTQSGAGGTAYFRAGGILTNVDNTIEGVGSVGLDEIDFVNEAGGTFVANAAGGTLQVNPETNFVNRGTLRATGGGILRLSGSSGGNYNNEGGLLHVDSLVRLTNGAVFRNETGGRVQGTATFETTGGTFTNPRGVVAPGDSLGILTIDGNYTQNNGGTLEIELAGPTPGTEHDQLVVTGAVALDGLLDVDPMGTVVDPATRGTLDEFVILTYGSRSGGFARLDYGGTLLIPFALGDLTVFFDGDSGTSGLPGMFRWIEYGSAEAVFANYLALPGDANGDGIVDGSDFNIWNANKFMMGTDWITGDFNGDGRTDGSDFNIWNNNIFSSVDSQLVPEPVVAGWLLMGAVLLLGGRRARN